MDLFNKYKEAQKILLEIAGRPGLAKKDKREKGTQ
jgi:hypothetical protein